MEQEMGGAGPHHPVDFSSWNMMVSAGQRQRPECLSTISGLRPLACAGRDSMDLQEKSMGISRSSAPEFAFYMMNKILSRLADAVRKANVCHQACSHANCTVMVGESVIVRVFAEGTSMNGRHAPSKLSISIPSACHCISTQHHGSQVLSSLRSSDLWLERAVTTKSHPVWATRQLERPELSPGDGVVAVSAPIAMKLLSANACTILCHVVLELLLRPCRWAHTSVGAHERCRDVLAAVGNQRRSEGLLVTCAFLRQHPLVCRGDAGNDKKG